MRDVDPILSEVWVCEGCQTAHTGVNPPDSCPVCEHRYFENAADVAHEKSQATVH